MWCCLFWFGAICAGVGAGVFAHLGKNGANDNKEKLKIKQILNTNKKTYTFF